MARERFEMATVEQALPLARRDRTEGLPILVGFRTEILPAVALLWTGITIAFIVTREAYLWPVAVWATVTTMMLWPVGRTLGRPYFAYRTPLFVLGVLSMGYIIFTGFSMRTGWAYEVKLGVFLGLPTVLSVFAVVAGVPWAISRPVRMFFRPDLLFGDGRVLVGGVISLVLGMRYLVGQTPPDLEVPVPANWSWYGILFAMAAGFIMIIPLRGIAKLLTRMMRVRDEKLTGWAPLFAKELFLVLALLSIGYGFHNVFAGKIPLRWNLRPDADGFWPAIGIVVGAALWIIVVRGAYKKLVIGDPFIRETFAQSLVKQALLLVGVGVLFYGFMSLMHFDAQHVAMDQDQLRGFNDGKSLAAAIPLMAFGTLLLVPIRAYIQDVQRRAILAQMASTILPTHPEPARRHVMETMMRTLVEVPFNLRRRLMRAMIEGVDAASVEVRTLMTRTRVEILAGLPPDDRQVLMECQAAALREVEEPVRVRAMSDMMAAVSQLPEEQRRAVMQQMASLWDEANAERRRNKIVAMKMDWKDMVSAMAEMSEAERQTMMKERLSMFAEMPEDQRKRDMQAMMMARESLPPAKRDAVQKSMEAAAMQLPEGPRQTIMRTQEELMKGMGGMGKMAMAGAGARMAPPRKKWWEFWK